MSNETINVERSQVDFSSMGASIKNGIVSGLKGVSEIENEIVNLVKILYQQPLKLQDPLLQIPYW